MRPWVPVSAVLVPFFTAREVTAMGCQRCKLPMTTSHTIDFQIGPSKLVLICPNAHYAVTDVPPETAQRRTAPALPVAEEEPTIAPSAS